MCRNSPLLEKPTACARLSLVTMAAASLCTTLVAVDPDIDTLTAQGQLWRLVPEDTYKGSTEASRHFATVIGTYEFDMLVCFK